MNTISESNLLEYEVINILKTIDKCKVLNIKDSNITTFNKYSDDLVKLSIINSNLKNIHFNIKNLKILDLKQNNLKCLDNSILMLKNLMYIDISFNMIEDISILNDLTTLKKIEANCNLIKILPNFSKLINLEYLSCYNNLISIIPDNLNTNNMFYFNIADNNIKDVPKFVLDLEYYNVDFNNISNDSIKYKKLEKRLIHIQYSDKESIHNNRCQNMLRESINRIIDSTDKISIGNVIEIIDKEDIFDITFKDKLVNIFDYKYSLNENNLISFGDILGYVFNIINKNNNINGIEIFYNVVKESNCNLSWVTNSIMSLATISEYVVIDMDPIDELANIIFKTKKELGDSYTKEEHKNLVRREFNKKGISNNITNIYVDSIDEL